MIDLSVAEISRSRLDRLGRGIMWLLAASAVGAFVSGIEAVKAASHDTVWVETWRLFGFLVFAGMFALIALRPRAVVGIWELAFVHKAAMAFAALFLTAARDAIVAGSIDAVMAVAIAAAYFLTRGWLSWGAWRTK